MQLKIVFESSDDGGYTVFVPALPGCVSEGETLDEARRNIREAIALYLEVDDLHQSTLGTVEEEMEV